MSEWWKAYLLGFSSAILLFSIIMVIVALVLCKMKKHEGFFEPEVDL